MVSVMVINDFLDADDGDLGPIGCATWKGRPGIIGCDEDQSPAPGKTNGELA